MATTDPANRAQIVNVIGNQIGNLVVLVLAALWQNGEKEAAKASLSFPVHPFRGLAQVAEQQGGVCLHCIRSTNPLASAQFPDCQMFAIPCTLVSEVWELVKELRIAALTELAAQETKK